jgi:hypothetical protein
VLVESRSPIDQAVFDRNLRAPAPEPGLDDITLWALAMVKANRNEKYGVEHFFERQPGGHEGPLREHLAYVLTEEIYHTRMLVDAVRALGVTADVLPPGRAMRALLGLTVRLPTYPREVLSFCAELCGVICLRVLFDQARALLGGERRALARVERLLGEILVDEAGHVFFLQSRLDAPRMALARALYPVVCKSALHDIPELGRMIGRDAMWRKLLASDLHGAVVELPERFLSPGMP